MSLADLGAYSGTIAAALSVLAFLPYIFDTLRRRSFPLRSTWLIWTILSAMSLFSNIQEGASTSLTFMIAQVVGTAFVFLLSIPLGMGSYLRTTDALVIGMAMLGVGLWWVTDSAVYALAISISVSALGGAMTVIKAYHHPTTETPSCWILCSAAAAAGVWSVGAIDPVLLAYPLYLLVLYISVLVAIGLGRIRTRRIGLSLGPAHRNVQWTAKRPARERHIAT